MAFHQFPDLSQLIAAVARELRRRDVGFMLIGGQAVLLHGAPRLTEDIDVTLALGPEELPVVEAAARALMLQPLAADPGAFVRETFVYPARHAESGLRVDFIFSTTDYERQAIARATRVELAGESVPFSTAEDLIIHKLFASRARDIEDAVSVVRRQGEALDWSYIEQWCRHFAEVPGREEMPAAAARLRVAGR